ncbi:hypothetical protein Droror1_Dr00012739 [Drosera rotundifolia]
MRKNQHPQEIKMFSNYPQKRINKMLSSGHTKFFDSGSHKPSLAKYNKQHSAPNVSINSKRYIITKSLTANSRGYEYRIISRIFKLAITSRTNQKSQFRTARSSPNTRRDSAD